ncbi:MAG: BRCT domain-containing protein [Bacteroidota bacterium]
MKQEDDFSYRKYTGPLEAHKAFNLLQGILDGIALDTRINHKEVNELELWCQEHVHLQYKNPFKDLINNIETIIEDDEVTAEEVEDMKWVCESFKDDFVYFKQLTSDLQRLQGVCHGILADGIVRDTEVTELEKWLEARSHLATYYPYDEISSLVGSVLADGKIDEQERQLLKKFFNDFVNLHDIEIQMEIDDAIKDVEIGGICSKVSEIRFIDHQFCFTGTSYRSSRKEITNLIKEHGGKYVNSVSKKTNYLIFGDEGNQCWSYACYGRKIEKAIQLRKEGANILIVHEDDLWKELDSRV